VLGKKLERSQNIKQQRKMLVMWGRASLKNLKERSKNDVKGMDMKMAWVKENQGGCWGEGIPGRTTKRERKRDREKRWKGISGGAWGGNKRGQEKDAQERN